MKTLRKQYDVVVIGGGPGGFLPLSLQAGTVPVFCWLRRTAAWAVT